MPVYPGSRYQGGEVLLLPDKNGVQQLSVYRDGMPSLTLREYVVMRQGTRLDQIAAVVFGNSELWWAIADANNVRDGYYDGLPAGTVLRIPDAPPST